MEFRQLRAAHRRIELGGLIALPVGYFALMGAGVFLYAPHYVVFSLLLVLMLLLQRPRSKAGRGAPPDGEPPREPLARAVLDDADACFLRGARFAALAGAAGYFMFLAGLDLDLRMTLAAARDPIVVFEAAAVGFAVAAFGRDVALRYVWKPFAARHAQVWANPVDLNNGRTARNATAFMEWRASVEEQPPST